MSNLALIRKFQRWSAKEDRDVMRMKPTDFHSIYGRTLSSIKSRREYINNGQYEKALKLGHIVKHLDEPPPVDVIVDRDRRLTLAPRDTTASLMGDPPPGYSALERKAVTI